MIRKTFNALDLLLEKHKDGIIMKHVKIILTTIIIFSLSLFCSCSSNSRISLPDEFDRGVYFGISEAELLKIESGVTFDVSERTFEKSGNNVRTLTSSQLIEIGENAATVSYMLINDKLNSIDYTFDVKYPKTQISDIPAYQLYDKYKNLLSDEYVLPSKEEKDDSNYSETYRSEWANNNLSVSIYVYQTVESSESFAYPAEIDDTVSVYFINQQNT